VKVRGQRRPKLPVVVVTATALALASIGACSVGVSGQGTAAVDGGSDAAIHDSSTPLDAAHDVGVAQPDAGADVADTGAPCTGVLCNGQCLAANDCSSCNGSPLLCASSHPTCVDSCSSCSDTNDQPLPVECYACDVQHANPIGACAPATGSAYCLSGNYFGSYQGGAGYHCGCPSGDAGECPGSTQVCTTIGAAALCVTCGEPVPTDVTGSPCKAAGTTCNPGGNACR
jgi:hypothetical protein